MGGDKRRGKHKGDEEKEGKHTGEGREEKDTKKGRKNEQNRNICV